MLENHINTNSRGQNDIIKDQMDLSTMMYYIQNKIYHNYTWLYEYFDLIVLNALTFSRPNSKYCNKAKWFHKAYLKISCGATFTTNRQVFCHLHPESVESHIETNIE